MRILAIRGENLASLGPAFQIDLAAEPLAGTGLFAITGETGAGKSTILDALCLALYGEYPRVDVKSREDVPDPSGKVISAADARAILRRGAGQGFAEVDFAGNDGTEYRVRWAVQRARTKAAGALQKPQRLLTRLADGHAVAEGIKPVLEAVVERTGLSFEQFRRTVLLAQGEFDRFILAPDNERAELLEKITGTAVYAELSKRAHAAWKERGDALKRLEERRQMIGLMDEAGRAALVDEIAAIDAAIDARAAEEQTVSNRLVAANRIVEAQAAVAAAGTALSEAEARCAAAGAERAHLARLDAVEPLRGAAEAEAQARVRLAADESDLAAARQAVQAAIDNAQRATEARAEARASADSLEQRRAALEPLWQEAARLDVRIDAARNEWDKAKQDVSITEARLAAPPARPKRATAATLRTLDAAEAEIAHLREEQRINGDRLNTAKNDRAASDAKVAQHERELADLDYPALRARDGHLAGLETLLREAIPHAAAREQALNDKAEAEAGAETEKIEIASANAAIARDEESIAGLLARRQEIGALAALADATQSREAIALRETLVEEKPCPVCGGNDHPYARPDHAEAPLVREVRARRQALDDEIDKAQRSLASYKARQAEAVAKHRHAQRVAMAAAKSAESAQSRLQAAGERLATASSAPAAPLDCHSIVQSVAPLDAAAVSAIELALAALAARRRQLAAPLNRAEALQAGLASMHKQAQQLAVDIEMVSASQAHVLAMLSAVVREAAWRELVQARARLLDGEPIEVSRRRHAAEQADVDLKLQGAAAELEAATTASARAIARSEVATATHAKTEAGLALAITRLAELAASAGIDLDEARHLLAEPAERRLSLADALKALDSAVAEARMTLGTRHADLEQLRALHTASLDQGDLFVPVVAGRDLADTAGTEDLKVLIATLTAAAAALDAEISELRTRRADLNARLTQDDDARRKVEGVSFEIEAGKVEFLVWDQVYAAIGDAEGAKFRRFAQGVTLEELVRLANRQLDQLAPRYRLAKGATSDLALSIIDRDMGEEHRSVRSLSGGERFLMSLALALALSGLEGRQSFVDTLFIDEGFGTLDAETLDIVIEALERLQGSGRKVGVITHVAAMVERIAVQVRVEPRGAGRSVVRITDRFADPLPLAS